MGLATEQIKASNNNNDNNKKKFKKYIRGPLAAARASSPMKKSRSSVPLFCARLPPEDATRALERPLGPLWRVAMTVGKMKDGESLPAKPSLVRPVPLKKGLC